MVRYPVLPAQLLGGLIERGDDYVVDAEPPRARAWLMMLATSCIVMPDDDRNEGSSRVSMTLRAISSAVLVQPVSRLGATLLSATHA